MAEYIERAVAIKAVEKADYTAIADDADSCKANYLREIIESVPAADVVPASQERTYKDLLAALLEDILETTYADACCMCTKGECDNCNLNTFTDALLKIIERATERKKRLTD